ncbi:uracil-DNA glycosylase family protein [Hyphomicrobium sp.]|uniref:uracil-DNA glycosylase family protein n=1 Tax=Hyphomicrobium sp. TaxID=82 RepID=UPI0026A5FB2D
MAETTIVPVEAPPSNADALDGLVKLIRACRICHDHPRYGKPLAHEPRPILQISKTARICIVGQAPGTRVHKSGRPFDDRSGARLRQWLGIDETTFYDSSKIAIIGMGFCFPGLRPDGSDLPPRRECAETWRAPLFAHLPNVKLLLLIGGYAQRWHLGQRAARQGVTRTVERWRDVYAEDPSVRRIPLPHPSWHNNKWLQRNTWFDTDLLPVLRANVRRLL